MPYDWRNLDPTTALSAENLEASAQVTLQEAIDYANSLGGRFQGEFQPNTAYRANDLITRQGSLAYAKAAFTSTTTYNDANWTQVFAQLAGIPLSDKGAPGGVATLDQNGKLSLDQQPAGMSGSAVVLPMNIDGVLVQGTVGKRIRPPTGGSSLSFQTQVEVPPSGQALIVGVESSDGRRFALQTNRPTIPRDGFVSQLALPDVRTFAVGDWFRPIIDQVGIQPPATVSTPTFASDTLETPVAAASVTVTRPAGMQAGDFHLMFLRNGNADVATPAGLTKIGPHLGVTNNFVDVYWRVDDGTTASWTFTSATAMSGPSVSHEVYRGVDPAAPVNASSTQALGTSASFTPSALTTTVPNAVIVYVVFPLTNRSLTTPAGYTPRLNFDGTTASRRHLADMTQAAAGVSDTASTAVGGSTTSAVVVRVALRPLSQAAPATWSPGEDLTVVMRYIEA